MRKVQTWVEKAQEHQVLYLLSKYLLSTYLMLRTVQGTKDQIMNETD